MLAGLPYVVWPVGSLFILASRKKDDPFLHYHAIQGGIAGGVMLGVTLVGLIALTIVFRLLPGTSTLVPGMLGMGLLLGGGMLAMLVFFTAVFLGWRATAGEMLRLPFIGDYAEGKMLDHTGMTRREFLEMCEESFNEPPPEEEPIPFPGTLKAQAMAHRAAVAPPALPPEPARPQQAPIIGQSSGAAARAAALGGRTESRPATPPQSRPAGIPPSRPAAATPQSRPAAASQGRPQAPVETRSPSAPPASPGLGAPIQPTRQTPSGLVPKPNSTGLVPNVNGPGSARPQPTSEPRVKDYSLLGNKGPTNVLQPSAPQRSPQPPQKAATPTGWQNAPAAAPLDPASAAPRVKEVDLIRHYKERKAAGPVASPQPTPPTDALRNWLTSVDEP